jgi:hypothetical protein
MYEIGPLGLAKVDAATWQPLWATAIPLPHFLGRYLSGVVPHFFSGYTEIVAFRYFNTDGPPTPPTDQVITAVNDAGGILVSCTTSSDAQNSVLLPRARILVLSTRVGVVAYSTVTGAIRWQAAAKLSDISGDTVYITSAAPGARVIAYDVATGHRRWSHALTGGAAAKALTIINGVICIQEVPAANYGAYALLAIRARDGALLWYQPLPLDSGIYGLQVVAVDRGSLLLLPNSDPYGTARIVDARSGHVVASANTGSAEPLYC